MIRVEPAPEPPDFDKRVRRPGLSAIAELVGEGPTIRRTGPKRKAVASRREDLRAKDFRPFWHEATDALLSAYDRLCAYACLYIERITGSATVDHWAPKSLVWDRVYEWDNYRLACSIMNANKQAFGDVIDPFEVEEGMFALDLVKLKAVPGPAAGAREAEVTATIKRLGLDGSDYSEALGDYYHDYLEGHISLHRLQKRAPFLAQELRRQGRLKPGDV